MTDRGLSSLTMRLLAGLIAFAVLIPQAWAQSPIPYRYSIQEGFILAVDDASSRSLQWNDPVAETVVNRLAEILESDQYRVPVQWGRTLVWHLGLRLGERMSRDEHLSLYREAITLDASRAQPGHVLFINLRDRNGALTIRMDWLELTRGERETRFSSDGIDPSDEAALDAFLEDVADGILDGLGPAPPTARGDVPPAWLIEPLEYRIDLRTNDEVAATDIVDALTLDMDHYIGAEVDYSREDRVIILYETEAPSWWIADRVRGVMEEYGIDGDIEPRRFGLRLQLAE